MSSLYKISATIQFPEGVAVGETNQSNTKTIARNGQNQTLLRGTSVAGILRSAYEKYYPGNATDVWFGSASIDDYDTSSIVSIADTVIECQNTNLRNHNLVNRHTGAVVKGGLFSIESVLPNAKAKLSITLKSGAEENYSEFIEKLANILNNDLLVGGSSNRGIGRMIVLGDITMSAYDMNKIDDMSNWLDAEYLERSQGVSTQNNVVKTTEIVDKLKIQFTLATARGEDFLIADGQDADYDMQPQKTLFSDNSEHWKIPGASLRGVFRAWMTRLAARDGYNILDSNERWNEIYNQENKVDYKPDLMPWGFKTEAEREKYKKNPMKLNDPMLDLFGSLYKKGRIHISDAYAQNNNDDSTQARMHVAIDRFSGGANEGALFQNKAFIDRHSEFLVNLSIENPNENEVKWLVKTLRALHLGIVLVGSSKAGGRLEIKTMTAEGQFAADIELLEKELIK